MRPDWKNAPEWAQWFSWDLHGSLFSEDQLDFGGDWWFLDDDGRFMIVESSFNENRGIGKERRPNA